MKEIRLNPGTSELLVIAPASLIATLQAGLTELGRKVIHFVADTMAENHQLQPVCRTLWSTVPRGELRGNIRHRIDNERGHFTFHRIPAEEMSEAFAAELDANLFVPVSRNDAKPDTLRQAVTTCDIVVSWGKKVLDQTALADITLAVMTAGFEDTNEAEVLAILRTVLPATCFKLFGEDDEAAHSDTTETDAAKGCLLVGFSQADFPEAFPTSAFAAPVDFGEDWPCPNPQPALIIINSEIQLGHSLKSAILVAGARNQIPVKDMNIAELFLHLAVKMPSPHQLTTSNGRVGLVIHPLPDSPPESVPLTQGAVDAGVAAYFDGVAIPGRLKFMETSAIIDYLLSHHGITVDGKHRHMVNTAVSTVRLQRNGSSSQSKPAFANTAALAEFAGGEEIVRLVQNIGAFAASLASEGTSLTLLVGNLLRSNEQLTHSLAETESQKNAAEAQLTQATSQLSNMGERVAEAEAKAARLQEEAFARDRELEVLREQVAAADAIKRELLDLAAKARGGEHKP